ncbi:hypothetical protein WOLCODRAFT_167230 [Wolfiporia cocos MD-104 SS10]|uniref:Uncharacterized protein n=1 Tax=Wolfiporia cocos (strain MD-104) TaxID=742152 RepID=A0A2H3JGV6_WOLCO|nr:hypothetical protein WOLCODRAFT_167230 [Wolfiporia cocos MD-104 SS10]
MRASSWPLRRCARRSGRRAGAHARLDAARRRCASPPPPSPPHPRAHSRAGDGDGTAARQRPDRLWLWLWLWLWLPRRVPMPVPVSVPVSVCAGGPHTGADARSLVADTNIERMNSKNARVPSARGDEACVLFAAFAQNTRRTADAEQGRGGCRSIGAARQGTAADAAHHTAAKLLGCRQHAGTAAASSSPPLPRPHVVQIAHAGKGQGRAGRS